MKKALILIQLFLFLTVSNFADTLNVKLATNFRLNPITGINGDENEASSKFVQRLIFSPLVFPLADPYLQDNYSIALDLSLIDGLEYRDNSGNWKPYDLSTFEKNPGSSSKYFRVNLRPNLQFNKMDERNKRFRWDSLDAEDVVYSYRIARITMDRAYKKYLEIQSKTNLGLNTLLYSKIRSFNDVYCDTNRNRYVYFEIDSSKSCRQFLELLVYVPVLSAMQVNNQRFKTQTNSDIYRSLHSNLLFQRISSLGQIDAEEYNIYDINKLLLQPNGRYNGRGEDFYSHPVGYGQYLIEYKNVSFGSNDPDIWKKIFLVKNPDWCSDFNEGSRKRIGSQYFNHNDYRDDSDRLIIEKSDDWDPQTLLNNLGPSDIIYNIPLSATLFKEPDAIKNISAKAEKRKMQISHSLYGIFFGPALGGDQAMMPTTREFFNMFADRVRMENIVKYLTAEGGDASGFDSLIRPEIEGKTRSLTHDLQMQKLYFPFYMTVGETGDGISNLGDLYNQLEKRDYFYQEYFSAINRTDLKKYYSTIMNNYGIRGVFFDIWVGGEDYPEEITRELINRYNQNARYILSESGKINIEVFYKDDDKIGMAIANHFVKVMDIFFRSKVKINPDIKAVPLGKYSEWQNKAKANARNRKLSFLVKGWNYKFDLLDELKNQFIDPQSFMYVEEQYKQLILGRLGADRVIQYVAQSFYENTIMIPLLGIQNYAVYYTNPNEKHFFDGINQRIEIMLLPFYWRKK